MTEGKERHCSENDPVVLLPKKPAQGQFCKGLDFHSSTDCHMSLLELVPGSLLPFMFCSNSHLCPLCDYVLRTEWSGEWPCRWYPGLLSFQGQGGEGG